MILIRGVWFQIPRQKKIREYNIDTLDTDEYILDRDYECYCDDALYQGIETLNIGHSDDLLYGFSSTEKIGSLTPNAYNITNLCVYGTFLTFSYTFIITPSIYCLKYNGKIYQNMEKYKDLYTSWSQNISMNIKIQILENSA